MPPQQVGLMHEPPSSIEFVLEENDTSEEKNGSNSGTKVTGDEGTVATTSSGNASAPSSSALHVSFSLDPQVVEIERIRTQAERDRLWYKDSDYVVMRQDAEMTSPSGGGTSTSGTTATLLRSIQWTIRSLWVGSFVMGLLATTTCTRRPS